MNAMPTQARVYEDASAVIMARFEDRPAAYLTPGAPILTAQVATISLTVIDVASGQPVSGFNAAPLAAASVWFDTLQAWSKDARGHNFRYTLAPGAFLRGGAEYRIGVQVTLTDGRVGICEFDVTTEAV